MRKTFAEFFAGIGLVRAGLEAGGWHCGYANDIDPKKKQMYEGHFGASPEYHCGDIWDLDGVLQRLPRGLSLATASFPCVDVSIAGHWRGLDGKHSSTFFALLDVLRAMGDGRPPILLIENVVGFVKSHGGDDFVRACRNIADLGYWLDAFILDAKWFVPQSRPRVFLLGVLDRLRHSPILTSRRASRTDLFGRDTGGDDPALRPGYLTGLCERTALKTGWVHADLPAVPERRLRLGDVLDDDGQGWWAEADVARHVALMQAPSRCRLAELMPRPATQTGTAFRRTRLGKPRTEVRFDIAGCLRTPKGGSARQIVVRAGRGRVDLRWMSAREYARLQGIPGFKICVPEQQAMYGFGDAVCVPAIEWIDRHLLSPLFDEGLISGRKHHGGHVLSG